MHTDELLAGFITRAGKLLPKTGAGNLPGMTYVLSVFIGVHLWCLFSVAAWLLTGGHSLPTR